MSYLRTDLPPITLSTGDCEKLQRLAQAAAAKFPRTADFLTREVARAAVVDHVNLPAGLVAMGSEVEFRDDVTGQVRRITLVYPHEADLADGKLSVLTPVGAALIGLSASQTIEWQSPTGGSRSLTVLDVRNPQV